MNNLRAISRIGGTSCGTLSPPRTLNAAARHQTLNGVLLVIGSKMGISHRHLDRPVAQELSDSAQISSGHYKSRGEGVPIAMPCVGLNAARRRSTGHPMEILPEFDTQLCAVPRELRQAG